MQNRYAGDVGDFGKLALLGALAKSVRVGVNWYLVDIPDEKTNDGRHIGYLEREQSSLIQCDPALARQLHKIVHGKRKVSKLEKTMNSVRFYHAPLTLEARERWHGKAMSALSTCDLVFLDPDNGLLVPSVKPSSPKSIKYVFSREIVQYYAQGNSVVFYNHRSRQSKEKYRNRFAELYHDFALEGAIAAALTYHAYSVRDYFFCLQQEHADAVLDAMDVFLQSGWGQYFSRFEI